MSEEATRCKDCGAVTVPGIGSARCPSCWDDKCGDLQMKPSRELDVLVAEKVMGFERRRVTLIVGGYASQVDCFFEEGFRYMAYSCDGRSDNAMMFSNGVDDKDGIASPLPNYSTDIAAAWEVVEKIGSLSIEHHNRARGGHMVFVYYIDDVKDGRPPANFNASVESDSAPHAICLAALKAVRYDAGT